MTELQAVIGKEQVSRFNYILNENKRRYQILNKNLSKYFELREIPENSKPNYDTFIFYVKKNEKEKILKSIKNSKFGTKNLPDSIKWHCSYYWDHVFNKKEIQSSKKTLNLLKTAIAIPILLKKSLKDYEVLVKNILKAKQV